MSVGTRLHLQHRSKVALIGTLALFVALIATAFAIGGSDNSKLSQTRSAAVTTGAPGAPAEFAPVMPLAGRVPAAASHGSVKSYATAGGSGEVAGGIASDQSAPDNGVVATNAASSLAATKIVKTGSLTIRVGKSDVETAVSQLTTLAAAQGGYVASSTTNSGSDEPMGEVVLRIPVAHFTDAINAAKRLGDVLSLTTTADDVTGHFVDLAARKHALEQTRSTYLTILGRARTIGATLAVQERIQDVQSQIDQLAGQLKLLSSQASYSTLTVDVTPDSAYVATVQHDRTGLDKAWHTSWSRFARGIDSIVAAIGPIVLALLILGFAALVGFLGFRGVRRVTS